MTNYDATIRINTNINPDKMDKYEINIESLERLRKNIEKIQRVLADSINIQTTKQSFEMLNMIVEDSFNKLSSVFEQYDYENMLKENRFSIAEMSEKIGIRQLEILQNIDFGKLFKDSFYQEQFGEVSKMAFEYAEEEIESEENIAQEELLEIFNEQVEDKIGWQERLYNKSETFKRKYFVFYTVFVRILFFVISQIAIYFIQLGMAYAFGNVTSEPEKDSSVIYCFDQRTEVNIIGETDNYYFITYMDSDGNQVMGYSDKEDMEIIPEEDIEVPEEAE